MSKTTGMHETVSIHLTPYGRELYRAYMDGLVPPGTPNRALASTGCPDLDMPLWEAFRIFGQHTVSSTLLPFEDVTSVLDSADRQRADAALKQVAALDALFGDIARALRLPLDYGTLRRWASDAPSEVPDQPAWWWLDDRVVRVDDTDDGTLVVVLGNGRRKSVSDVEAGGWGGPALRDPRLVMPEEREDEDIPF